MEKLLVGDSWTVPVISKQGKKCETSNDGYSHREILAANSKTSKQQKDDNGSVGAEATAKGVKAH